jgi:hypothetical protein
MLNSGRQVILASVFAMAEISAYGGISLAFAADGF